jgi:hypothetical protein
LSHALLRRRLIALVAAIALIAVSGLYAGHAYADHAHEKGHCDLCLHFGGTAGSPPNATVVAKPVLVVRAPPTGTEILLPFRRKSGNHLPRGPPARFELI